MRASDLPAPPLVSRRAVLGVASLILLGGCTSAAEQAHPRFFAAVKNDPLFSWRPEWMTFDTFGEVSGNQPLSTDVGAELRRLVGGGPVPIGAIQAATHVAETMGWSLDSGSILLKKLETKDGTFGARVEITALPDYSALLLDYWMWGQTP